MPHSRMFVCLVIAGVLACRSRSAPEKAMIGYVDSVRGHQCETAMKFLSAPSRHAIDVLTVQPQDPHAAVPIEHYFCYDLMFEDCKLDKLTLKVQDDRTAVVSMPCGRTQDSFLPGFPSMFLKYEPRDTNLVREGDEWHVELPYAIAIVAAREREELAIAEMRERQRQRAR